MTEKSDGDQQIHFHEPVYGFVGGSHNQVSITFEAPSRPVPFMAPPLPPQGLVGRDGLLTELKSGLLAGKAVAVHALQGLPGVGKSALAVALANDREVIDHFVDGILWAGLGPRPDIQAKLSLLAIPLGIESDQVSELSGVDAWAAVIHSSIGARRMLIVIDDAWSIGDALALKLGGPNCAHLLTTRLAEVAVRFAVGFAIRIPELLLSDGLALLRGFAPRTCAEDPATAEELVQLVGGLPLALILIGKHLAVAEATQSRNRLARTLDQLREAERRLRLEEGYGPLDRPAWLTSGASVSLNTVIDVSVANLDTPLRPKLRALATFAPKPNTFRLDAALEVSGATEDEVESLVGSSLVELSADGRLSMHQTISDFLRGQGDSSPAEHRFARFYAGLLAVAAEHQDEAGDDEDAELNALRADVTDISDALRYAEKHSDHEATLTIVDAGFPLLNRLGLYLTAADQLRLMLADGADRPELPPRTRARLLHRLSVVLEKLGNLQDAEAAAASSVALVGQHADLETEVEATLRLGWSVALQGRTDEGRAHFERARRAAHEGRLLVGEARANQALGWVQRQWADHDSAREYLYAGLELAKTARHAGTVSDLLQFLGWTNAIGGRYDQAEAEFRECLEYAERLYLRSNEIDALHGLGWLSAIRGRYQDALPYFDRALAVAREIGHHEQAPLLLSIGWAQRESGNLELADQALREALSFARREGRAEKISQILKELGHLARQRGDLPLAADYLEESLATARQVNTADAIVGALQALALVRSAQGDVDEGRAHLEEALRIEQPGGNVTMIAMIERDLGEIEWAAGYPDVALLRYQESVALAEANDLPEIAGTARFGVALALRAVGDHAAALAQAGRSLEELTAIGHHRRTEVQAFLDETG
ncbi:tetratricopeptide repeat protein [Frankia gtarii]|uniref:tetratricopeptide repeat protein n=1 Tax=Frankia gtarii TaxID=2950102 RepID=UPI0021BF1035|nr:tetratricopeptide repeat protein [Frankia gtarii]